MRKRDSERKFPVEFRAGRRVQAIRCACGSVDEKPLGDRAPTPDDAVAGHFRTAGWDVDPRLRALRHLCPDCVSIEAERRRFKRGKTMKPTDTIAPPATPTAEITAGFSIPRPLPRPDLASAKVDATMLLGDHYDVAAKTYRDGWGDERIAKDSGAPIEWVRRRREDDFGPMPAPKPKVASETLGKLEPILSSVKAQAAQIDRLKGALANLTADGARSIEAIEGLRKFLADPAAKEAAP